MRVPAEILEVADDARVEGRSSRVNHTAIVEAAGTLRRIANRLSSIATGRLAARLPQLDDRTERARGDVFEVIRRQLQSWLDFFRSPESLNVTAAQMISRTHSADDMHTPLKTYGTRVEEREFARIESWTLEDRREILTELQSLRRLDFLMTELNRSLAQACHAGAVPLPASIRKVNTSR
jgi:hypothetical protein